MGSRLYFAFITGMAVLLLATGYLYVQNSSIKTAQKSNILTIDSISSLNIDLGDSLTRMKKSMLLDRPVSKDTSRY